jgi:hypothetical protein
MFLSSPKQPPRETKICQCSCTQVPENLSHKKAAGENEDLDFYQDCGDIIQAKIRQVIGIT